MIRFTDGDLFGAEVEALVNAVNTVGVMGKGVALAFKAAFPENFRAYAAACRTGEVEVGRMFVTERRPSPDAGGPRWIVNFPTKRHWRDPSRLEWIEAGLVDLRAFLERNGVGSVALPALGSGNGGLDWEAVRPMIEAALSPLRDVEVLVYRPLAPAAPR